jgi:hypothetical protein
VKYSSGPLRDGCEPLRVICIAPFLPCVVALGVCAAAGPAAATVRPPVAASMRLLVIMASTELAGIQNMGRGAAFSLVVDALRHWG